MTLWDAPAKHTAVIAKINPNVSPMVTDRLREMGLDPGQSVMCLRRGPFNGAIVVQVGDCIYSLEPALARQIILKAD